ncbi:uncharacterized protein LOC128390495 [Panonychus citri]|uniref:uncharacterized protein LOC128390495 n=1 Tax=Panonychus citri TaxID=50023 RepID=UPI0023070202|nr:uncharacterized protein LOC128390495 [Panonychus citri]
MIFSDFSSNVETNFVSINCIPEDHVLISMPFFHISTNPGPNNDRTVDNVRAVHFDTLTEMVGLMLENEHCPQDFLFSFAEKNLDLIVKYIDDNDTLNIWRKSGIFKTINEYMKALMFDEKFTKTIETITFDPVRVYETHPNTNLLINFYHTGQFYSLLRSPDEITTTKRNCNDTDYNRAQYVLARMTDTLCNKSNRIYDTTLRWINLLLLLNILLVRSFPIEGYCSNNLKLSYMALAFDFVVRSRLIDVWQRDKETSKILNLIFANYKHQSPYIKLLGIESADKRASLVVDLLYKNCTDKQVTEAFRSINIQEYFSLLKENIVMIEGCSYYKLDESIIYSWLFNFVTIGVQKLLPSNSTIPLLTDCDY